MRFLTGSSDNLLQPWLCRVVRPIQSNPASILNPTGQDSTQPNTCLFYKRFVSSSFCRNEGFKWLQDVSGVVCHRFIRLYEESLGAWPRFDIDGVSTLLRCYTEGFFSMGSCPPWSLLEGFVEGSAEGFVEGCGTWSNRNHKKSRLEKCSSLCDVQMFPQIYQEIESCHHFGSICASWSVSQLVSH